MVLGDGYVYDYIGIQHITIDRPSCNIPSVGDGDVSELHTAHYFHLAACRPHGFINTATVVRLLGCSAKRLVQHAHPPGPGTQAKPYDSADYLGVGSGRILVGMIGNTDVWLYDDVVSWPDETLNAAEGLDGCLDHGSWTLAPGYGQIGAAGGGSRRTTWRGQEGG